MQSMKYLLHTSFFSGLLSRHPEVMKRTLYVPPDELAVSTITWLELQYSLYTHAYAANETTAMLRDFFGTDVKVLDFDLTSAEIAAEIRRDMIGYGKPMLDAFDLQIAATAVRHNLVLVVAGNIRGLALVKELTIIDWSASDAQEIVRK